MTGKADNRVTCGVCAFVMDEVQECPRCKEIDAEIVRRLKAKQEKRAALLREVEEILKDENE